MPKVRRLGFTLVELLVVIGIIAILLGILIPVVGKVRVHAQAADTKNLIAQITGAIERYHNDFNAYPGPVPNDQIRVNSSSLPTTVAPFMANTPGIYIKNAGGPINNKLTGTENLVLGLMGGLYVDNVSSPP